MLMIAQLVYWDASRNKIGRQKGEKGFLNMPAGGWAALSSLTFLAIGPITWVLYLLKRKKMIAKAITNPIVLSKAHRIFVHILLFIIPVGLSYLTTPKITASESSVHEELALTAADLNKGLPQKIDEVTQLDNISVENLNMSYHYTVNIDSTQIATVKKFVTSNAIKSQCGDTDARNLIKEHGVSYLYDYKLTDGTPLFQIHINNKTCGDAGY